MIGKTLSQYRITEKLGQGGMGEVWRAEDTRLGRDVALKMLPESFAQDPERLARFEREARVLASLSHANIAGIHGIEEVEGKRFLVMEVAEGETLAERVSRGPIPVEDAVRLAKQVAEAVEAAHEKGIVHRDLKPGNVKVTEEGRVKVLDFGLAKALAPEPISADGLEQDLSLSPTLSQAMTGAGVLLGTAGYMSPEQARGKAVDRRADIWAFGCLLYEMLTGRRLYRGETATDVVAAIVHGEPALDELPSTVPGRIRALLERCLQKDPNRRLQSIGDARIALQEWLESPEEPRVEAVVARRVPWWVWLVAAAAGLVGLVAGGLFAPEPEPEPVRRFDLTVSESQLWPERGAAAVISPDGRHLVFNDAPSDSELALKIRSLDQFETTLLVRGERQEGPHQAFFSPDGKWLGFMTFEELRKMPLAGGSPIRLAEVSNPRGASWSEGGMIVFAPRSRSGLSLVPAAGGEVRPLTEIDQEGPFESHRWPQWLPGGEAVLFSVLEGGEVRIEAVEVASGERKVIHPQGAYPRYVPTGHILFVDNAALFALPFDPESLEATGSPMPVLEGIESQQDDGEAQFDVSGNGVLVYKPGADVLDSFTVAWADREGNLSTLWDEPGIYGTPKLSPDGKRLVLSAQRGDDWDVWVYDIDRDVATRLTFGPGYDADAAWSPDGRWVAFTSDRDGSMGMYRKRSDGTGEADVLIEPGRFEFPAPLDWASDNSRIVFTTPGEGSPSDLWFLPLEDGEPGEPEPFLTTPFWEGDAEVSPDSRWIAYRSNETGQSEIYVRPLDGSGKWQISDGVGAQPRWSPDGRELFIRGRQGLMAVAVEADGSEFRAGRPELLFGEIFGSPFGVFVPGYAFYDYDVGEEGNRFVVFPRRDEEEGREALIHVVTGWFEELRSLTESVGG